MKRSILFSIVLLFIIGNSKFLTGYVDLGDDPEKIKIESSKKFIEFNESPMTTFIEKSVISFDGKYIAAQILEKATHHGKIIFYSISGSKIHEIQNAFFPYENEVSWFKNSNKFLYQNYSSKEYYYYDLVTNKSHPTGLKPSKDGFVFDSTRDNELAIITNGFYLYNLFSKKKSFLGTIKDNIWGDSKVTLINKRYCFYRTEKKKIYSLWCYDFEKKISKNIFPFEYESYVYKKLKNGKDIIVVYSLNRDRDKDIYVIDLNGNTLGAFKAGFDIEKDEFSKKGYYNFSEVNPRGIAVSPNGKLIIINMIRLYHDDEDRMSLGTYIFNIAGKSKKLKTGLGEVWQLNWSSQGNYVMMQQTDLLYVIKLKKI